jgi:hypothetical protein
LFFTVSVNRFSENDFSLNVEGYGFLIVKFMHG